MMTEYEDALKEIDLFKSRINNINGEFSSGCLDNKDYYSGIDLAIRDILPLVDTIRKALKLASVAEEMTGYLEMCLNGKCEESNGSITVLGHLIAGGNAELIKQALTKFKEIK